MESLISIGNIIGAKLILNKYIFMNNAPLNEVVVRRVLNEEEEMVLIFYTFV